MTDTPALFRAAAERFGELVHMVGDDQWANPTPCSEWDVRALVNHVHTEVLWVPPLFGGQTVAEVGDRFDGDLLGDDPGAAWDRDIGPAEAAIDEPDAMPRSVSLSRGPTPGQVYADELFSDLVIHGWDLAKGIGADDALDPEWVEVLYAAFKPHERELKSYGMYGDMVVAPEGADLQTKLLAVVGRRRDWPAA
jgi:uncharacterized protein (TIGR03086 family)